jgi:hypothetical protein
MEVVRMQVEVVDTVVAGMVAAGRAADTEVVGMGQRSEAARMVAAGYRICLIAGR